MGHIEIEMFATLDLVAQSPGGPDEDPVGFPFGGWQAPLLDEVSGAQVSAAYESTDALLTAIAEHHLLHAREGGEVSGAAPQLGCRAMGCLGHRGHSMIQPPSTLIV